MEKQKKKSRHSKHPHNRQYKDRLWRIVEQLFISDWDSRKVTDNKKRNILVLNYNNYCVKFSSQVNFTTKIEPFAWTNGPISFRDLFHSPFLFNCTYSFVQSLVFSILKIFRKAVIQFACYSTCLICGRQIRRRGSGNRKSM